MFVCSVGDEVATHEEQMRAKNDRQALIVKCRKLQADFDKLVVSKKTDTDALHQEVRDITEEKRKEVMNLTCQHTLQMTQLQSSLMGDIDIYYTKVKYLEDESTHQQEVITSLRKEIAHLEVQLEERKSISSNRAATQTESASDVEHDDMLSTSTTTESMASPSPSSPSRPNVTNISNDQLRDRSDFLDKGCCSEMSSTTLQQWNEKLRSELQRVHLEQQAGTERILSLKGALANSEAEREKAELAKEALHERLMEVLDSKDQVLVIVQQVQQENKDLKKSIERMKHL